MYGLDETKKYDVVGIGNAILDILAKADDAFLEKEGMVKGTMQLIDEMQAENLYEHMSQTKEVSGGSAANTLAGMASLGSKVAFIGKVRDDQLGTIYRHDLTSVGVEFDVPAATEGKSTGCCYIIITPDAERTMNTYLGAGSDIYNDDIDEALIGKAKIVYGEGYQWSTPQNKEALKLAFEYAKKHGAKVAFTLSDLFCVEAHRTDFQELLDGYFDILFANEQEIQALYPEKSFDEILDFVQGKADAIVITRGASGSVVITPNERVEIAAASIKELVDTTGAGDLYAAGFLHQYCKGVPLKACGDWGSQCAAAIIQHVGARSLTPLNELVVAA